MASRKSSSGGPWQVIVEEMRSQNRATLEAIARCRASIEGRLDRIEREWRDRDATLALAIADFRRDLSSARAVPPVKNAKPMSEDENPNEPSVESLEEIPEQDFSRAIRPNRYANLRGAFQHAVFVEREVWEHFGSAERIRETLRLLVDIAKKRPA
jgi:hypothetical protein